MKKLISLALALFTLIAAAGCKGSGNTSSVSSETTPANNEAVYKSLSETLNSENPLKHNGRITDVACLTKMPRAGKKLELELHISELTGNMFDPDENAVELEMKSSDGKTVTAPAFFYRAYGWSEAGRVGLPLEGTDSFRLRVTPPSAGTWDYKIIFIEKGNAADTVSGSINIYESKPSEKDKGFIRVDKKNPYFFSFESGGIYQPIGHNVCWNNTSAPSYDWIFYSDSVKKIAENGGNYMRMWMAQYDLTLYSSGGKTNDFTENLHKAAVLDRLLDTCAENGVYITMTFYHHGQFMDSGSDACWGSMPFKYGKKYGYLKSAAEFWTDEHAISDAKCYIRYMIARYGYSKNILNWELCNEISSCTGEEADIRAWCAEMCDYIRKTDANSHMISVSSAKYDDPIIFDKLFDFINVHWYGYASLDQYLTKLSSYTIMYNKPVFASELGISWEEAVVNETMMHQQIWSCAMGLSCGAAASWYWEQIDAIPENGGYKQYKPLRDFLGRMDLLGKKYYSVLKSSSELAGENISVCGYRSDTDAYVWFYDTDYNYQSTSAETRSGVSAALKLNAGKYKIEWIDPWTGDTVKEESVNHEDGMLRVNAPDFNRDIAVAVIPE